MVSQYFETVADPSFARDAAVIVAGFLAPTLLSRAEPMVTGVLPVSNIPNEAYGVAVAVLAEAGLSGTDKVLVQYGGMVYSIDAAAERFGIKERVEAIGGDA